MGWERHKLLWDGNGTDKYVPQTTLAIWNLFCVQYHPDVHMHCRPRIDNDVFLAFQNLDAKS